MQVDFRKDETDVTLVLSGSFTFSDNQSFRALLTDIQEARPSNVTVDMGGVDFIDSAALGMMLLLRDTMQTGGISLELRNPQGQIKKMFDLSNFNELFIIK